MPRTLCQSCSQPIEFPDELAGQETPCPVCGQLTRLTTPSPPPIRIPKAPSTWARDTVSSPVTPIANRVIENIEKAIIGKRQQILLMLAAWLSEGHVLLEDVPGVAKTMLARALAQSVGCTFHRLQCTPDLLPTDITGASIFNPKTVDFEFRPGPLFAQIVLVDEINRATPRSQSALLEAMAERQVTVDGTNYELERPFFLIATQNPVDHEGTFPLPEAQLDRFLVRLSLGYPSHDEEDSMLERQQTGNPLTSLEAVVSGEEWITCQDAVRSVRVDPRVREYLLHIVRATRDHDAVRLGGSPRASLALFRASQAYAAIRGYDFVLPDDVKEIAPAVLEHRLILRPESRLRKFTASGVVADVLNQVPVPVLADGGYRR